MGSPLSFSKSFPHFWFPLPQIFFSGSLPLFEILKIWVPPFWKGGKHYENFRAFIMKNNVSTLSGSEEELNPIVFLEIYCFFKHRFLFSAWKSYRLLCPTFHRGHRCKLCQWGLLRQCTSDSPPFHLWLRLVSLLICFVVEKLHLAADIGKGNAISTIWRAFSKSFLTCVEEKIRLHQNYHQVIYRMKMHVMSLS